MDTVSRINADELESRFLKTQKALFKNKEIESAVCEPAQSEEDATVYLLRSPTNRARLLSAIENVPQEHNFVTVSLDELQ